MKGGKTEKGGEFSNELQVEQRSCIMKETAAFEKEAAVEALRVEAVSCRWSRGGSVVS